MCRRSRWRRWEERSTGLWGSSGRCVCFLFFCLLSGMGVTVVFYSFPLYRVVLSGGYGEKETLGDPHYNCASWFGGRKGVYLWREKAAVSCLRGAAAYYRYHGPTGRM